jgi:hypothetical protein
MRGRVAILGALLAGVSCHGSCASQADSSSGANLTAAASASAASPPDLAVTELARANERFQGLSFNGPNVYFGAMFHGLRRVPKAGGPIESVAADAPHGIPNSRHAYFNGYPIDETSTSDSETESFSIKGASVYRTGTAVKTADHVEPIAPVEQNPSVGNIARSTLVVDDTNVYWIGGGVSSLFSVPRAGGPVRKICSLGSGAIVDDLAISGDTIYVIELGGSIDSIKKTGADATTHLGDIGDSLGPNRNAIWAEIDGNFLYVVSDATESMTTPTFDSRVVKVKLPAN